MKSIDDLLVEMKRFSEIYISELENESSPGSENYAIKKALDIAREIDERGGIDRLSLFLGGNDISMKAVSAAYLSLDNSEYKDIAMKAFRELTDRLPKESNLSNICHMYLILDEVKGVSEKTWN